MQLAFFGLNCIRLLGLGFLPYLSVSMGKSFNLFGIYLNA